MTDTAVWLIVGVLLVGGLAGTIVPFLPGTPLIVAGALVHAVAYDWRPITPLRLGVLAALAVLGFALSHAAGALGARRAGGSRWAVAGAIAGGVVGLFLGIPGLLLGPPIGAIAGEMLRGGGVRTSVRTGLAACAGMLAGAVANFAIGVTMIGLFVWWSAAG
jgi:uncharacterized protein YqgC (DUF456 family)